MSDEELGEMLSQMEPKLRRMAKRYLYDRADQQDAVQECLYKAWRSRKRIDHPEYFTTWVTRIMINVCLDALRKRNVISSTSLPDHMICTDGTERFIEYEALYAALSKMAEEDRQMIRLRYFEGYGFEELSAITHLPVRTIQSKVYRTLRRMRRYLSA